MTRDTELHLHTWPSQMMSDWLETQQRTRLPQTQRERFTMSSEFFTQRIEFFECNVAFSRRIPFSVTCPRISSGGTMLTDAGV